MKLNLQFDKKFLPLAIGAVVVVMVFLLFIKPLFGKVSAISARAKALDDELRDARAALARGSRLNHEKQLLARNEVSRAINEITNLGNSLNINFLSTNPQRIEVAQGSQYPTLPIQMEVQSTYKDLGIFLGTLETTSKNVVTVKTFSIDRNQEILPEIQTEIVFELYLKEGEGG